MTKFEYKVEDHSVEYNIRSAKESLDNSGEEGWELVSAVPLCMSSIRYLFKRVLTSQGIIDRELGR